MRHNIARSMRGLAWQIVDRGLQFDPEVNPRDIVWGGILSRDDWAIVDVFYSALQTYESPTLALSELLGHNTVLEDAWKHPGDYQPRQYL